MGLNGVSDNDNIWLSVACLATATSFPSSPWEHRVRQEYLLKEPQTAKQNEYPMQRNCDLRLPSNCSGILHIPESTFPRNAVREVELVSRCMYALQGVPVAVAELELLAKRFSHQAADRSLHRLPTLWQRSASTNAVGEILAVIAQAGRVRCRLQDFVDYFLAPERQIGCSTGFVTVDRKHEQPSSKQKKRSRKTIKQSRIAVHSEGGKPNNSPPFSLVNQAFAAAVKSILQGHLAALNTLTASVLHRRSMDSQNSPDCTLLEEHIGSVIGLGGEEVTLLELHLHTSELRLQLETLASLCLSDNGKRPSVVKSVENEDWPVEGDLAIADVPFEVPAYKFGEFPRGADLLTFLYHRLKEADVHHVELLCYLFSHSCQPYLEFLQSWLYHAAVKDPYEEFFVDECAASFHGTKNDHSLDCLKESASVPCFLKKICTPLVRAGQQLQVLLKLAEVGDFAEAAHSCSSGSKVSSSRFGLGMLKGALKCWTDFSNEKLLFSPVLTFGKKKVEELIKERERARHELMEKFDTLFERRNSQNQGVSSLGRVNVSEVRQLDALEPAVVADEHDAWEVQSDQDTPCTVSERKSNLDLTQTNKIGDLKEGKDAELISNFKLEGVFMSANLFSGVDGSSQVEDLGEIGYHDYKADTLEKGESTEGQACLESRFMREKQFLNGRTPSLSDTMDLFKPGSKQRRKWKEPVEVVIVHGKSEEDAVSVLNVPDEGREVGPCQITACMSDQKGEAWLFSGFSIDPSLDDLRISEIESCDRNLSTLIGVDYSQNGFSIVQDAGLKVFSLEQPKLYRSPCSSFTFLSPGLCLEETGPEKFFGRSQIWKLGQKYGNKDACLSQNSLYTKSLANLDAVSQELWSLDVSRSDRDFDLCSLSGFASLATASTLNSGEKLDLCSSNDNSDDTESVQDLQYKSFEPQLNQFYKSQTLSNRADTVVSLNNCSSAGVIGVAQQSAGDANLDSYTGESLLEMVIADMEKKPDVEKNLEMCQGGATWESCLKEIKDQEALEFSSEDNAEIPLEVVVDKCIVQEVISQYHCVSYFTVRLLHEVFGLQEHLTALRRYFFMERGDWADAFTTSLYQHVWYPSGAQQRQLEIQAMLESALQNSSCESDEYAERLVVHVEGCGSTQPEFCFPDRDSFNRTHINKNCVTAFDFIMLGYDVGWPINLILTPDCFKLYNSIFNFLIRSKLTLRALGDVWQCLKELSHLSRREITVGKGQDWQDQLRLLMLFRQQISHFVTILQDYVESQLLYDAWSKFLHAIYEQAKDLQDLQSIHDAYLKDALHQCFLSDEMGPVKVCIDEIMQCLLDLRSCLCFSRNETDDGQFNIQNDKVYSAVLGLKKQYEESMLKLHHLTSRNYHQASQFWMRLDFNGFLTDTCSRFL